MTILFKAIISIFFTILSVLNCHNNPLVIDDVSRLNQTPVYVVMQPKTEQELQNLIVSARKAGKKISLAGKRHSQGGQISFTDNMVIDICDFNKIIKLDLDHKIITVQSGATWKQIQEYCNPYNLSIKSMQSFSDFTIGGSLSVNVHGQDVCYGPLITTILGFRILTADGKIVAVSRTVNPELFKLVIGGYGLFGIIIDVAIALTDNVLYRRDVQMMSMQEYPAFFKQAVKNNNKVELHFARFDVNPRSNDFLQKVMTVTHHVETKNLENHAHLLPLHQEKYNAILRTSVSVLRKFPGSRKFKFGAELAGFRCNQLITRNNAMYNDVHFLDYTSSRDTDILQEYFIPLDRFEEFVTYLKNICLEHVINLLNITIRYIPQNNESVLSYAQKESFAFVLYINHERTQAACITMQQVTQKIIDKVIMLQGTYYLPYQLYASRDQFEHVYPQYDFFFAKKLQYDPEELFVNHFYMAYK